MRRNERPSELRHQARQDLATGAPLLVVGMVVTLVGGPSLGGWWIPAMMVTVFGASRAIRGAMRLRLVATQERLVDAFDAVDARRQAVRTVAPTARSVVAGTDGEPAHPVATREASAPEAATFEYSRASRVGIVAGVVIFFALAALSLGLAVFGALSGDPLAWTLFWLAPFAGFGYLGRHGLTLRRYADVSVVLTDRGLAVVRPGQRRTYTWDDCSRIVENRVVRSFRLLDGNDDTIVVLDRDSAPMATLHEILGRELAARA